MAPAAVHGSEKMIAFSDLSLGAFGNYGDLDCKKCLFYNAFYNFTFPGESKDEKC